MDYIRRVDENCPAASTSAQFMLCMRSSARLRTEVISFMMSACCCSMLLLLLLLPLSDWVLGAGGMRAAEGSRRGSRRHATGSLGWNMFTRGIR